jgi:hypothetical protein
VSGILSIVLVLFIVASSLFPVSAQDDNPEIESAIIGNTIQSGIWLEQWVQEGTRYCSNSDNSITATNEPFLLSTLAEGEVFNVRYRFTNLDITPVSVSAGKYVWTDSNSEGTQRFVVTVNSPIQMSVVSTFFAKDDTCQIDNYATWFFSSSADVCAIWANGNVTTHYGPGNNYQVAGQLPHLNWAPQASQAYDSRNQLWLQLLDNRWVQSRTVVRVGNCQ